MEQTVWHFLNQQSHDAGPVQRVVNFIAEHDIEKVVLLIRQMDWQAHLHNPKVYLFSLPLLGFLLWKRKFRHLLALFSLGIFIYLLPFVLPQGSEYLPLRKLLIFAVVTLALVLVNLYFLLIRRD
jgi:hypothetical protein